MSRYYAPCAAQKLQHVAYAEELIYPDFEIREPYFAKDEHRDAWRAATSDISERAVLDSGWMAYRGQTGQNFVFNDVKYSASWNLDSWSPKSCMSSLISTSSIQPLSRKEKAADTLLPAVTIAHSPDSYSFQHHLDRVTHIIAQGAHLLHGVQRPYAATGRRGPQRVQDLWARLGYDEEHVLYDQQEVEAETMVFSCRAVLIHPWLSLKTLEAFGIEHDPAPKSGKRNKVVYMTRSDGRALNRGRRIVNEEQVLDGIRALLAERGRGEELVVFNPEDFKTTDDLFSWFNQNVAAVVGPHGGAMINHRWAAKGTFVLEMLPTTRVSMMIFEEASVLSQTYAAIVVPPTQPEDTDMEVDVRDVVELLQKHLGIPGEDPLRRGYHWRAKELGLN
ncbi:hypothetical protein FB45DRAFT_995127 [Roridomyces roridus]|uniref:Glycosyltransferase 61 catalytic domain-containing protein n=1 Tax=Roridomyces roridus TaxID=1738132 RepID=A0AAD7F7T0_9AGAR|nr:hypothetical protein FB45DRAFT_995127 [Roridomyces roridus]